MSGSGVREGVFVKKTPTEKMGDLVVRLARWTGLRVFKGLGEQVCESAGGASFNWRTLVLGHLW